MSSKPFQNKNVLITGGTTGIGRATAQHFIDAGARVILTGRNPDTLTVAKRELGDNAEVIASDAADESAVAALFQDVGKRWPHIDVLFLNAGIAQFAPISELSLESFDKQWQVNVRGVWLAVKHALPLLKKGARVIANASVVNQKGLPGASGYAPTKAAVSSLVRTLAAELAPAGILVNSVSPGPIETPIYGKMGMDAASQSGFAEQITAAVPLSRFGQPKDIANAVLFLAGQGGEYITGIDLPVDGGFAQV